MRALRAVAVGCILFTGCADQARNAGTNVQEPNAKANEGLNIEWPGGSFQMDAENGIQVRAKGVDVDVDAENNVDVRAPGVEADVKDGAKVNVSAAGVDVRTDGGNVDVKVGAGNQ